MHERMPNTCPTDGAHVCSQLNMRTVIQWVEKIHSYLSQLTKKKQTNFSLKCTTDKLNKTTSTSFEDSITPSVLFPIVFYPVIPS